MEFNLILPAALLIIFVIPSQSALAATIDVTYSGSANFGSGSVGYETGAIAPNPNYGSTLVGVGIGGDSFTTNNTSYDFSPIGQFNAWCVDIYHWMISGTVTYNVATGSDLATELSQLRPNNSTGTNRVNDMILLADEVYSFIDTKVESAAFQLAIWAIAYGTADQYGYYQINTTDIGFRVDNATVTSAFGLLANDWLKNLGTAQKTGNYTLTYLNDGAHENTQDVVVFTDPPLSTIPEPGTIMLVLLGLISLSFVDGKQRKINAKI